MTDRPHLVVTGLMGVGKSTIAGAIAADRSLPHRDSDVDLQRLFGSTGAELAAEHGVDQLHVLEAAVLLGALGTQQPSVISAAAWVVEDPWCRRALRDRAFVVVLTAPIDVLIARIPTGPHRRPVAAAELAEMAKRREPLFSEVADLMVDASLPVDDVVDAILDRTSRSDPA